MLIQRGLSRSYSVLSAGLQFGRSDIYKAVWPIDGTAPHSATESKRYRFLPAGPVIDKPRSPP